MTEQEFSRLSSFIERELGIKMPAVKRVMLESRLARRMKLRGIQAYSEYIDFVFSEEGVRTELINMIDAVTTNKTDFFREADHFDYLLNTILPSITAQEARNFRIWSAGCSTGEEPYTLAMVLEEHRRVNPGFTYTILATDISTKVLSKAADAVYEAEKVASLPHEYKKRYMLRSKDRGRDLVRMKKELRDHIDFRRLNFMDEDFGIVDHFDVIFCRNVIIYFDKATQTKLISKFRDRLKEKGILFLGHSETMMGMNLSFKMLAPTVYRKE
ncbi:protein-glutamate O-methyltransferase [Treponema sp.]